SCISLIVLLFCVMSRRPRRSPLFPYTTLFRSQWAVESQGPIQDRTREHLAASDKCIYTYRRMLVKAIEATLAGEGKAPMLLSDRSEEHTSELQSRENLVCRLLLEKKKQDTAKA